MARAKQLSEVELLNELNEHEGFLAIQMLKDSLGKVGYDDDLLTVYYAFQEAVQREIQKQVDRLVQAGVEVNFHEIEKRR